MTTTSEQDKQTSNKKGDAEDTIPAKTGDDHQQSKNASSASVTMLDKNGFPVTFPSTREICGGLRSVTRNFVNLTHHDSSERDPTSTSDGGNNDDISGTGDESLNGHHPPGNMTPGDDSTRYIYVEYDDRVAVFRETTV